jgi:hypothetical protein
MSKQQYDLSKSTDYLNRKMFLDPAGPVVIQRFEEVKYKKIADFEEAPAMLEAIDFDSQEDCEACKL